MMKVNGCCCFELETGGKIIAWLNIIITGLLLLLSVFVIFGIQGASCDDILEQEQFRQLGFTHENCGVFKTGVTIGFVFLTIYAIVILAVFILLLKGISNRDPGKVIPSVVIQGLSTIVYVAQQLLSFTGSGVVSALIGGALGFYFFLVLYSIWHKIREEKRTTQAIQFSQP